MSTGPTDPITLEKVYELLQATRGSLEDRLEKLETKQYNTAPSWLSQITDEMRAGFAAVDKEMSLMRREIKNLAGEVSRIRAGHDELEDRVERIEHLENKH